jgi:hypothetical protein
MINSRSVGWVAQVSSTDKEDMLTIFYWKTSHLRDVDTDRRIILKGILEEQVVNM